MQIQSSLLLVTCKRYSLKLVKINLLCCLRELNRSIFLQDVISAVREVFPNSEHIYCLRSIHEQMKVNWPGRAFKDHLWRCATASTVVQFEKSMDALKTFSQAAHAWLSQIPPNHWSRSHFSCKSSNCVNLVVYVNWSEMYK